MILEDFLKGLNDDLILLVDNWEGDYLTSEIRANNAPKKYMQYIVASEYNVDNVKHIRIYKHYANEKDI